MAETIPLNYLRPRGEGPKRPRILTVVGLLSITIGFLAASGSLLFFLLELFVGSLGPPDAPRPFDLSATFAILICFAFLTSSWLFAAGIRIFTRSREGFFSPLRMHQIYIVMGLLLAVSWGAFQAVNDLDVTGDSSGIDWIYDGLCGLFITGVYPAFLIVVLRLRSVRSFYEAA